MLHRRALSQPPIARAVAIYLCDASIQTLLSMSSVLPSVMVMQLRFRCLRMEAGEWGGLPTECLPFVEELTVRCAPSDDHTSLIQWRRRVGPGALKACSRFHLRPIDDMPLPLLNLLLEHRQWLTHLTIEGALLQPAQTNLLDGLLASSPNLVSLGLHAVHYGGHRAACEPYTACPNLQCLQVSRDFWKERALGCTGTRLWGCSESWRPAEPLDLCLKLQGGLPEEEWTAITPTIGTLTVLIGDTHTYLLRSCLHSARCHVPNIVAPNVPFHASLTAFRGRTA